MVAAVPPGVEAILDTAQVAGKLSRSGVALKDNHAWTVGVRDKLQELERERNNAYKQRSGQPMKLQFMKMQPSAPMENKHDDPKETAVKRLIERRNLNVDAEKLPMQLPATSDWTHAHRGANHRPATETPIWTTSKLVHAHKMYFADDGLWRQTIYDQVYNNVYSEIYDEVYAKAYNTAYNNAYGDGLERGGLHGRQQGSNRGFEDGYEHGYMKEHRLAYAKGQENARDMLSSKEEKEEKDKETKSKGPKNVE
ncbi:hypothetical protein B0T09DRAFT_389716 [Sordaria sp. MPI-SDFR-AT-0083]|nr:hypothetical protein B0T09DRAFT_389716 [Sordaria sp. MPI-SDFR-AT-0083]